MIEIFQLPNLATEKVFSHLGWQPNVFGHQQKKNSIVASMVIVD
jgi:hypothetical protein